MSNRFNILPVKLLSSCIFLVGFGSLFQITLWTWRKSHRPIFGLVECWWTAYCEANALIIVCWQHPNSIADSRIVTPESASTEAFKDWRSRIWGSPVRKRSWRELSPSLNLANFRSQVLSVISSSGYCWLITRVVNLVFLPWSNIKWAHALI